MRLDEYEMLLKQVQKIETMEVMRKNANKVELEKLFLLLLTQQMKEKKYVEDNIQLFYLAADADGSG